MQHCNTQQLCMLSFTFINSTLNILCIVLGVAPEHLNLKKLRTSQKYHLQFLKKEILYSRLQTNLVGIIRTIKFLYHNKNIAHSYVLFKMRFIAMTTGFKWNNNYTQRLVKVLFSSLKCWYKLAINLVLNKLLIFTCVLAHE